MPTATNELITHNDAARAVADLVLDRTGWIITVPPGRLRDLILSLAEHTTNWTAYLDNGSGAVLRTQHAGTVQAVELLAQTAAVVTVPKTVSAAILTSALGQPVPPDGSQDIVILASPGEPTFFPMLFVDALAIASPATAAQLRANQVHNLN